jgi:hypothetical protein
MYVHNDMQSAQVFMCMHICVLCAVCMHTHLVNMAAKIPGVYFYNDMLSAHVFMCMHICVLCDVCIHIK